MWLNTDNRTMDIEAAAGENDHDLELVNRDINANASNEIAFVEDIFIL